MCISACRSRPGVVYAVLNQKDLRYTISIASQRRKGSAMDNGKQSSSFGAIGGGSTVLSLVIRGSEVAPKLHEPSQHADEDGSLMLSQESHVHCVQLAKRITKLRESSKQKSSKHANFETIPYLKPSFAIILC